VARRNNLLVLGVLISLLSAPAAAATFAIADSGTEFPINWEKYGTFTGRGTSSYRYKLVDRKGLAAAMGAGLYPNPPSSINGDPTFRAWASNNRVPADFWSQVNSGDPQVDFYAWTQAKDVGPGAKLLFTAKALAQAGHISQALKAYNAVLVLFPGEPCWSADHSFVWYVAGDALGQIESLTTRYPDLGWKLDGAKFNVENGHDTDLNNDIVTVDPGKWIRYSPSAKVDLSKLKTISQRGLGKVRLAQYENGHWQLLVRNKPFVVHAVTYHPIPIGESLGEYGHRWMTDDSDDNGRPDAPYDTFVDKNDNGTQDADEKAVGDFQLMKEMGVNAIRLYHGPKEGEYDPASLNKKVLRDLHDKYGISVIMGDFLGAYTVGSGASWDEGTDYTDPVQLENMRRVVRALVLDHRSEPYVLMWLLGNENLMPADYSGVNATRTKAAAQVDAYLKFVNEIAEMIHQLDPEHPVAVGNLALEQLERHRDLAPAVDIFGANLYLGATGFGRSWKRVRESFDRPLLITEYGCDAWNTRTDKEDEKAQADYHEGNWEDIRLHLGGGPADGNAIGGIVFEFLDEWWKSQTGSWDSHDNVDDSPMAFPDGWSSEEYLGLVSLGEGKSPFLRRPRKAYYLYKEKLWKAAK
jgi:hypothetical protein